MLFHVIWEFTDQSEDAEERSLSVFGIEMHWLVWYLVTSFAFVLVLRKPLGVVI